MTLNVSKKSEESFFVKESMKFYLEVIKYNKKIYIDNNYVENITL